MLHFRSAYFDNPNNEMDAEKHEQKDEHIFPKQCEQMKGDFLTEI